MQRKEDGKAKAKKWILTTLKFVVAGALIIWLIRRGSLNFALLGQLATHPVYLTTAFLTLFLNVYLNNFRWVVLLRGQGFQITMRQTLPLSFIGLFFNYAMPGGVGGDLVKGYYLMQDHKQRRTAAATTVLMDRLIGFVGMILMSLIAVVVNFDTVMAKSELKSLAIGVVALFLAFFTFFAVAFSKTIYHHPFVETVLTKAPGGAVIRKIYEAVHSYNKSMKYFWMACGVTMVSQAIALGFFISVGNALAIIEVPIFTYAFAVPLGLISTALPISPAGIGVGQLAFAYLFDWSLGVKTAIGSTLVTAQQVVTFILSLSGAYFYFRRKKPNFEEIEA